MPLDIPEIRRQFPALSLEEDGMPRIYLDNPGGTQVPGRVPDAMRDYLIRSNANHGGYFRTSVESDSILHEAHRAMADFLNAPSEDEIIFGPNMTTLTYAFSRSVAKGLKPGDEIVLSGMDHDANVAPWLQIAEERQARVKWLKFNKETYRFDLDSFEKLLSEKVKLVAVGYASNAIGTVNDIQKISRLAHQEGALVYVDAVHYAPHGPIDVQALDCDFLVCSAYKFFGPHQGILWGRKSLLEELPAYKVRPADSHPPGKFETGTQSHEGQAGTLAALRYLEWIGETMAAEYHDRFPHFEGRRKSIHAAMAAIREHEKAMSLQLVEGLQGISGARIYGITDPGQMYHRVPTVAFSLEGHSPHEVARKLAQENIFVWSGNYYAIEAFRDLGLNESEGLMRAGAVHYNIAEEIDKFLEALRHVKG